jgi:acetyl-CoA carboxylase biotin carboxyl carrier protein
MTGQVGWEDLLDLVARLDANDYENVSVQFGDISVRMSRSGPLTESTGTPVTAPAASAPDRAPVAIAVPAPVSAPAAAAGPTITSPMIGVFYRRPSPGAPAFVEPGQAVTAETTIGIIEIMKLMNPIKAGVSGVIREFRVSDGEAVEYGQVLASLDEESS